MPEGIDDSSDAGSCCDRLGERRIRVVHDHHHPDGPSGECPRTEILVLGRLIGHPKFGSVDREARDNDSIRASTRYTTLAPKTDL
jgi:hypothetical protein